MPWHPGWIIIHPTSSADTVSDVWKISAQQVHSVAVSITTQLLSEHLKKDRLVVESSQRNYFVVAFCLGPAKQTVNCCEHIINNTPFAPMHSHIYLSHAIRVLSHSPHQDLAHLRGIIWLVDMNSSPHIYRASINVSLTHTSIRFSFSPHYLCTLSTSVFFC